MWLYDLKYSEAKELGWNEISGVKSYDIEYPHEQSTKDDEKVVKLLKDYVK